MGQRRDSGIEEMFKMFRETPWFIGPVFAVLAYAFCAWFMPWYAPPLKEGFDPKGLSSGQIVLAPLSLMLTIAAPWFAGVILLVWSAAEFFKYLDRRLVNHQHGSDDIRNLSWQEFERLLCEMFRRQGYLVDHSGNAVGGDGGIDIRLEKAGQVSLVQCKHWKKWQVGVAIVRELLGVVTSEKAHWGIIVTSGTFTDDAVQFASKNHVQLIDGKELLNLLRSVESSLSTRQEASLQSPQSVEVSTKVACPTCGGPMTLRTAKKGANAGTRFYGCQSYPNCKGTRPV